MSSPARRSPTRATPSSGPPSSAWACRSTSLRSAAGLLLTTPGAAAISSRAARRLLKETHPEEIHEYVRTTAHRDPNPDSLPCRGPTYATRPSPRSRAGRWSVLGGPTGRPGNYGRRHREGRGRHDAAAPRQRRSGDRGESEPRAEPDRRQLYTERRSRGGPAPAGEPNRVRLPDPGNHRHPRRNDYGADLPRAGGRDPRAGRGDRLWDPAPRGHHRLGLDSQRRGGKRRRDHQRRPDDPGPGGRGRGHAQQRRAGRRHADPDPRRRLRPSTWTW